EGRNEYESLAAAIQGRDLAPGPSANGHASASSSTERPHVWFLLDRSGSMKAIASAVITGFSRFVEEQASSGVDAALTVVQFDSADPHETAIRAGALKCVRPLHAD